MEKRICLVSGGNRGMGFETCHQLAQLGHTVILTARNSTKGKASVKQLREKKDLDIIFYQMDVSKQDSIDDVHDNIIQHFGRLDVLVNNAGILYDTWQSVIDIDFEIVNQTLETNLLGPWRLSKKFIPIMKKNRYGRIVNVSSSLGSLHSMDKGSPAYSISKTALNALTRKLAAELLGTGILVNSIDPGWVATDMGGRGGRPIEEGVKGIVWACTLPDDGPTGGFLFDGKPVEW
ncbi:MAG TPA: SDR family oxidoreductase [Nitrososphaeraceae archaeon]|nr:SDR family oxidoreductase [Nitrososphaeraceae archaeon]